MLLGGQDPPQGGLGKRGGGGGLRGTVLVHIRVLAPRCTRYICVLNPLMFVLCSEEKGRGEEEREIVGTGGRGGGGGRRGRR